MNYHDKIYLDKIDPSVEALFSLKTDNLPLPKALRLQLTGYCNMSCTMCPCSKSRDNAIISHDTLARIVEVCGPYIKTLGMSYLGEPTLHPDFWGVVDYLSKGAKWNIGLQTNGTTLTETFCKRLLDSPIKSISVSLDTLDPVNSEKYRPGSDHERIRDGVLRLLELKERRRPGLIVILRVFLDEIRLQHYQDFFKAVLFWKSKGCYAITPGRMFNHAGAITDVEDHCVQCRTHVCPCIFPWYYLVVGVNGEIRPCCMDVESKMTIANINEIDDLPTFWNGSKMRSVREGLLGRDKVNPLCENCNWRYLISALELCP